MLSSSFSSPSSTTWTATPFITNLFTNLTFTGDTIQFSVCTNCDEDPQTSSSSRAEVGNFYGDSYFVTSTASLFELEIVDQCATWEVFCHFRNAFRWFLELQFTQIRFYTNQLTFTFNILERIFPISLYVALNEGISSASEFSDVDRVYEWTTPGRYASSSALTVFSSSSFAFYTQSQRDFLDSYIEAGLWVGLFSLMGFTLFKLFT